MQRRGVDNLLAGLIVTVLALGGVAYSVRAGMALVLNYRAKYGADKNDADRVLQYCRRSMQLYPQNYHLCIRAAEQAYRKSQQVAPAESEGYRKEGRYWCERGLSLNRYKRRLHWLMTRFVWPDSPARAIAIWEAYTEWHFWDPYNHAYLAELYALAGSIDKAEQELRWVKGSPLLGQTEALVAREKTARAQGVSPAGSVP